MVDAASDDYFDCVGYKLPRLDDKQSDALTIAKAVHSSCSIYFDRWQTLSISSKSLTPNQARGVYYHAMETSVRHMPEKLSELVLQHRNGRNFDVSDMPEVREFKRVTEY